MPAWFDAEITKWTDGEAPPRGTSLAMELMRVVDTLVSSPYEKNRRQRMASDLALYSGRGLDGIAQSLFAGPLVTDGEDADGMGFNLCFGKVNTIRNRICGFRPRGQFLPQAGDRKAEQGADDKTNMCDAWMREQGYWSLASLATRDRLTLPNGWLKYYRSGDGANERVAMMRVPPWQVLVDPMEGLNGRPDCIYDARLMKVPQASREFGIEESVLSADEANVALYDVATGAYGEKTVVVVDAYYRGPDGRHVVMVGSSIVVDEPWEHDGFPLECEVYEESETGYGVDGVSVVRVLRPLQEEVNEWELAVREAHHLNSQQVWVVDENDNDPKIDNSHIRIMRTKEGSKAVQVVNPPAINQEMYKYLDTMDSQADKIIGLNEFAQKGTGTPALESKPAIREWSELQTDRLALESQKNEHMAVMAATWWWRLTRDMCRENKEATPKWRSVDRGAWREMVFGDLDAEYMVDIFPTSLFGTGVSGQLDKANDLIKGGWLSREDAMRALHMPDLSPIVELQLSEGNAMQEVVDRILEDGEYTNPDPYLCDKTKLNQYAAARYRVAFTKSTNYPKANMAMLRRLIRATGPKPAPAVPGTPAGAAPTPPGSPVAPIASTPGVPAPAAPTAPAGALVIPPSPGAGPAVPGLPQ